MTKAQKRLARLQRTRVDVSPEELKTVLLGVGFVLERQAGSHMIFSHPALANALTIPFRRPVKPAYVAVAYNAIKEVLAHEDRG